MLDRGSTFEDKKIVEMLKSEFVPVAFDQWYIRQQRDAEGDFYRKIAGQSRRNDFNQTTQGFYIAKPDGELYFYNNNRGPERVRALMKSAIRDYRSEPTSPLKQGNVDERFARVLPEGAATIRVRTKIVSGYAKTQDRWKQIFQDAVARDNLWILKDEIDSLALGKFPAKLAKRIARFHLVDNTRGEPNMWKEKEIRELKIQCDEGQLKGFVKLNTDDEQRGFEARIYGVVAATQGKLKRFDLVAEGEHWGEGTWTRGAPKGKFKIAIAFELADGNDIADDVAPQGTKGNLKGYIK